MYVDSCVYFGTYKKHAVVTAVYITQKAAIALEPLTTHPDEWAEPYLHI